VDKLKGYLFENSHIEKCWRVTSYILSQYEIVKLSHPNKEHWCPFENEFQSVFKDNFIKELIEIASLTRVLLDSEKIKIPEEVGGVDNSIGTLKYGENEEESLTYREACNKLIHSKEFSIQLSRKDLHPLNNGKNGYEGKENFASPIIKLRGTRLKNQNEIDWTTNLDFLKFINIALTIPSIN
jgi:hypothetical protein